jgi:hypothetical protein
VRLRACARVGASGRLPLLLFLSCEVVGGGCGGGGGGGGGMQVVVVQHPPLVRTRRLICFACTPSRRVLCRSRGSSLLRRWPTILLMHKWIDSRATHRSRWTTAAFSGDGVDGGGRVGATPAPPSFTFSSSQLHLPSPAFADTPGSMCVYRLATTDLRAYPSSFRVRGSGGGADICRRCIWASACVVVGAI